MSIPFELIGINGDVVARGTMPPAYVLPRIIVHKGESYALLSAEVVLPPDPVVTHRYIWTTAPYGFDG